MFRGNFPAGRSGCSHSVQPLRSSGSFSYLTAKFHRFSEEPHLFVPLRQPAADVLYILLLHKEYHRIHFRRTFPEENVW